jgi:hypothetical protein
MARPSKPVSVIKGQNNTSRRTKRELAVRERGEKSLLTGEPLSPSEEVLAEPEACKEFQRVRALLEEIDKDDALYSAQINRYCMLRAEERALVARKAKLEAAGDACEDPKDATTFYKLVNDCDRELMSKRKMMMDIEKENVMTIAAALRTVPKKPEKASNPLLEVLNA